MKRGAVVIAMLGVVALAVSTSAVAQSSGNSAPQNQAAQKSGQASTQAAAPAGKRPPQAKTQPEFDAYRTAIAITGLIATDGHITSGQAILTSARNPFTAGMVGFQVTVAGAGPGGGTLATSILSFQSPGQVTLVAKASTTVTDAIVAGAGNIAAQEKAANDFAAKYPDSELRLLLFKAVMHGYQQANNGEKMMEMAQKVLSYDPDDPEALLAVAQVLAERTRDTDLDHDQKLAEARKDAQRALVTVDTDVPTAGYPPEQLQSYKNFLRSEAYEILGALDFNAKAWPDAEGNLKKSIDAFPQQVDPVAVLRLSLTLDQENRYPDALKYANQAVELTKEGTATGDAARKEKDRLMQLTGAATPAPK